MDKVKRIENLKNLKLAVDSESIHIYIDNGEDEEIIHVVYYHEDEWLEDSESVTPAIIEAMYLFYNDKEELLNRVEEWL